jgi:hypothetical protein
VLVVAFAQRGAERGHLIGRDLREVADTGEFQMGGVAAEVTGIAVQRVARRAALDHEMVEIRRHDVGHSGATRPCHEPHCRA